MLTATDDASLLGQWSAVSNNGAVVVSDPPERTRGQAGLKPRAVHVVHQVGQRADYSKVRLSGGFGVIAKANNRYEH